MSFGRLCAGSTPGTGRLLAKRDDVMLAVTISDVLGVVEWVWSPKATVTSSDVDVADWMPFPNTSNRSSGFCLGSDCGLLSGGAGRDEGGEGREREWLLDTETEVDSISGKL